VAPSLHDGVQVHAGDVIGTVDVENNNNTHVHVEIDAFGSLTDPENSLRFSYGAIKRLGSANPNLVTDLIYFLPTSAQGVPTFSIPPVLVCTSTPVSITSTPASNTRYVGAQMGNSAGNVTLVYAARDGEHNACFKTTRGQVFPILPASQCSSVVLLTPTPGASVTPTLVP